MALTREELIQKILADINLVRAWEEMYGSKTQDHEKFLSALNTSEKDINKLNQLFQDINQWWLDKKQMEYLALMYIDSPESELQDLKEQLETLTRDALFEKVKELHYANKCLHSSIIPKIEFAQCMLADEPNIDLNLKKMLNMLEGAAKSRVAAKDLVEQKITPTTNCKTLIDTIKTSMAIINRILEQNKLMRIQADHQKSHQDMAEEVDTDSETDEVTEVKSDRQKTTDFIRPVVELTREAPDYSSNFLNRYYERANTKNARSLLTNEKAQEIDAQIQRTLR